MDSFLQSQLSDKQILIRLIAYVSTKANCTLSFLRRNLQINSPVMKTTAYNTLVRPIVEFAPAVWDSYTVGNICILEKFQHRATRYMLNRFRNRSSMTETLTELGWTSLEEHRKHQRLSMLYKIRNNLVDIDSTPYITRIIRPTRNCNAQGYVIPQSFTDHHKYSFFQRTVTNWNGLTDSIVSAPSLAAFKTRLLRTSKTA